MIQTGIQAKDVEAMRDAFYEGYHIKTPMGEALLQKKYPHFAQTDKGCFKWIEIYLAEHGGMCEDRKGLVKEIPKRAYRAD